MGGDSGSRTSPSLLAELCRDPTNQETWNRFVDLYGPKIYGWCRRWNLQDADAQDVTQNVLLKLSEKMQTFRYDPSRRFRAWLKTLTQHTWSDFVAWRQKLRASGDTAVVQLLDTVEAREDFAKQLEAAFDQELLDEAMHRVQARVLPRTWEAFRLTALEGLSGAAAAERLGIKVANVFVAKSDVLRMLREEVAQLEEPGEP
jgi:RNA polymerase sigma factor (sigma-70 family)